MREVDQQFRHVAIVFEPGCRNLGEPWRRRGSSSSAVSSRDPRAAGSRRLCPAVRAATPSPTSPRTAAHSHPRGAHRRALAGGRWSDRSPALRSCVRCSARGPGRRWARAPGRRLDRRRSCGEGVHRAESAVAQGDFAAAWGPARVAQHVCTRASSPARTHPGSRPSAAGWRRSSSAHSSLSAARASRWRWRATPRSGRRAADRARAVPRERHRLRWKRSTRAAHR